MPLLFGGSGSGMYGGAGALAFFTGGTIAGVTGVPVVISSGGIAVIGISSGSVAANGAISGITALPLAFPDAYCYFPANIVATVAAAGFYYCTFSTTTAGVAFLNTWTSGVPTIPTSPTAVTDGKGAYTGDTGEEFLQWTIPALSSTSAVNALVALLVTNNANAKTLRLRYSGTGGTAFLTLTANSVTRAATTLVLENAGSTSKQNYSATNAVGFGLTVAEGFGAVASATATTYVLGIQRATATDNLIVLPPTIDVRY